MKGDNTVLVAGNASTLRGPVHHIDEVGIIALVDGGRTPPIPLLEGEGEATNADVADAGGYDGGTDGAVRGHGVGFDVDGCFHIVSVLSCPKLRGACIGLR